MRIMAMADLHGRLPDLSIYENIDCLLIAGDLCPDFTDQWDPGIMRVRQTEWLQEDYAEWEKTVPAKHIFMTPGNHDWITCLPDGLRTKLFIDAGCELGGKSFWFTPWINPFGSWNYMLDRKQRKERFAEIPKGLDVLVSHSPALDMLDKTYSGIRAGCPELRQAIYRAQPKVCVFGHIHEGQRDSREGKLGETRMLNVAMWSAQWEPTAFEL